MQGSGVASLLVDTYEKAIPKDIEEFGLSVHKDNGGAINFYKTKGFEVYAETEKLYYLAKKR